MATNFYFRNYDSNGEQNLFEDLIIESIKMYGFDLMYIPRVFQDIDEVYGEDAVSSYNSAYPIEMYVKNVEGFGGEGDFFSKFNLELRDTVTFTVARRTFSQEVGASANLQRPREGDLIYFSLSNDLYKITFVEHEPVFYALGRLNTFDITCEKFEYSNERLDTGIEAVDIIERQLSTNMVQSAIQTEDLLTLVDQAGFPIILDQFDIDFYDTDMFADNSEIQTESDSIIDFSESNPFSERW